MDQEKKDVCDKSVPVQSPPHIHLRTEQRNKIGGGGGGWEVGGGILLNEIRVMDGCHLSLGFCKYRNSVKTETFQTRGFGKNVN